MGSFFKTLLDRNPSPAVQAYPAAEAGLEASEAESPALEEAKAPGGRYVQGSEPAGIDHFGVLRQAGGVFEPSAFSTYSSVQLYGLLEAAAAVLGLVPTPGAGRARRMVESYMENLRGSALGEATKGEIR
ncbi:hypothetical protein [Saccharibacillus alkalitolerans]|uniref:Uncharacterized protein n=1 Tax=Saccharibacillus alkalitolerans TaxID=2705290 RepID=A0ABX0F4E0_9BACL|nr:hypothetical protein [Saccharibacillus alkalitolerans]NGZ75831.1 hypothetical protein [Saccharibacillus alkalitolerans]